MKSTTTQNPPSLTTSPSQSHTILTIGYTEYLLPNGANITAVLEALEGLREVSVEALPYADKRVIIDKGEVEYSVALKKRPVVTRAEYEEMQKEDAEARRRKYPEATEA